MWGTFPCLPATSRGSFSPGGSQACYSETKHQGKHGSGAYYRKGRRKSSSRKEGGGFQARARTALHTFGRPDPACLLFCTCMLLHCCCCCTVPTFSLPLEAGRQGQAGQRREDRRKGGGGTCCCTCCLHTSSGTSLWEQDLGEQSPCLQDRHFTGIPPPTSLPDLENTWTLRQGTANFLEPLTPAVMKNLTEHALFAPPDYSWRGGGHAHGKNK